MKNPILTIFYIVCFFSLPFSHSAQDAVPQDTSSFDLTYQVNQVYPFNSITRENLVDAQSLGDIIKKRFNSDWVKSYNSVEISALNNGKLRKAVCKDSILTQDQINILSATDKGTYAFVKILYMPNNSLSKNDEKEMSFNISIDPAVNATFPGGDKKLASYLQEHARQYIADTTFTAHNLTAVNFTINELGQPIDVYVSQSSNDKKVDDLLFQVICDMPKWTSAEYLPGKSVRQKFVLTVGDIRSCTANLLDIRALEKNLATE